MTLAKENITKNKDTIQINDQAAKINKTTTDKHILGKTENPDFGWALGLMSSGVHGGFLNVGSG